ncbi:MAG: EVE domain-containing protein [Erysipelotrichaceae bacterium]|nr:EVE domain-containing protein [Erysipelotrichaceae bacterium]
MLPIDGGTHLRDNFQKFLDNYLSAKRDQNRSVVDSIFLSLQQSAALLFGDYVSLTTRYGYAIGAWANVPWIAILDQNRPATIQAGEYIVFLFKKDMSGVYLTLNQGVSQIFNELKKSKGKSVLRERSLFFRNSLSEDDKIRLSERGFSLIDDIDLAPSGTGLDYEPGTIINKLYTSGSLPSEEEFVEDLRMMIDIYMKLPKVDQESYGDMKKASETKSPAYNPEKRYWIFQSNPQYYDIVGAINKYTTMYFTVSRYKAEIKQGDTVFLWASGEDAGIYAVAEVKSSPYDQEQLPLADEFYPMGRAEGHSRSVVDMNIEKILSPPLLKEQLTQIPELRELSVIKSPQGTNFAVTETQGKLIMNLINEIAEEPLVLKSFVLGKFIAALKESNLKFDDLFVLRFVASLMVKKFTILTGLSGSGKTKLATTFANWIAESAEQVCLVPVGADWTNREPLLGFSNALVTGSYVKPDTGVIDLLLRAKKDPKRPYFLILDEMNLSHVERYFADFLSAMESEEKILLHPDDPTDWNGSKVPASISLPKNLFIIGTVNVDETTYMFSPKVLDRAFVHEFRVSSEDMRGFLDNPIKADTSNINFKGAGMAMDFLEKANATYGDFDHSEELKSKISLFFDELKNLGSEFGYRTASEIYRYGAILSMFNEDETININNIIDASVVSKLLPKIHGSRRKLEQTLISIFKLCLTNAEGEEINDYVSRKKEIVGNNNVALPVSIDKIVRMHRQVIQDGFTSFSEA